jgi:hypothetical protein
MSVLASLDFTNVLLLVERVNRTQPVTAIIICNRTATDEDVSLWIVPHDTPRDDAHAILSAAPIRMNQSIILNRWELGNLTEADEIWVQGSAGSTMSITIL